MGNSNSKSSYDVAAAKVDDAEGDGQIKPVVSAFFFFFILCV